MWNYHSLPHLWFSINVSWRLHSARSSQGQGQGSCLHPQTALMSKEHILTEPSAPYLGQMRGKWGTVIWVVTETWLKLYEAKNGCWLSYIQSSGRIYLGWKAIRSRGKVAVVRGWVDLLPRADEGKPPQQRYRKATSSRRRSLQQRSILATSKVKEIY